MKTEVWHPIPGYEGYYEVSNRGSVRSVDRLVKGRHSGTLRLARGTTLQPATHFGYLRCNLALNTRCKHYFVHALVLAAFIGPRPDGLQIRHLDGNRLNNTVENLAYGTASENTFDAVRHGTHPKFHKRTHCLYGHEWIPENIRPYAKGFRCTICQRNYDRNYSRMRRASKRDYTS